MNNPLPPDEWALYEPLVGNTMIELGNKRNPDGVYKPFFESIGFRHVSIDWNGEDGALRLDLRQPIDLDPADMVTNIGTTEHVSDQAGVWANVHRFCRVDGVILSMCPRPGDWWWHGEWYPWPAFYQQFADLNGYEIERLDVGREFPNRNIRARLRKVEDREFTMPGRETLYRNTIRPRHAAPPIAWA